MKTAAGIIFILFSTFWGMAQNIAKADALKEIAFLNDAVQNGHPINYDPAVEKINFDNVLVKIGKIEKDSLTRLEYRLLLNEAIFKIGCVHTSIINSPPSIGTAPKVYFPIALYIVEGKLTDSLQQEIEDINGIGAQKLLQDFGHFFPSDGATRSLSTLAFNKNSSLLISAYFNYPKKYLLHIQGQGYTLNAVDKIPEIGDQSENDVQNIIFKEKDNVFYAKNGVPILRMKQFSKHDKSFIKETFNYLSAHEIDKLVLDLRDNLGGNRKTAIYLSQHLIPRPFEYSIVRPKLSPEKYLNGKGRLYFILSKIKYNAGKLLTAKNTGLGRVYSYGYKPKKNSFSGQIYVLTNGYTASSSTMVTSWLKQYTQTTFIGSQSAGGYNGNNGGSFPTILLPTSKYEITFPLYRLILDKTSSKRDGIIPDTAIVQSFGEDNVLEEILQRLNSRD